MYRPGIRIFIKVSKELEHLALVVSIRTSVLIGKLRNYILFVVIYYKLHTIYYKLDRYNTNETTNL